MKTEINFISANAITENEIHALYLINNVQVYVIWSNIDAGTGKEINWYLDSNVICSNEIYCEKVENSIALGEEDHNENIDIYLSIRDTFDMGDCESLLIEFLAKK